MSVYFIREGDLVKIGYSSNVRTRAAAVINGLRGKGELLGFMPGDRTVEKHMHQMFAADREYGEWFRVSDRLLSVVEVMTSKQPMSDEHKATDRLLMQEERYAEEGAYFIRQGLKGCKVDAEAWRLLENSTSIPAKRLEAIYDGTVCPITAGEYVVLRMLYDASIGITPGDMKAAQEAAEGWAKQYGGGRQKGFAVLSAAPLDRTGTRGGE